MRTRHFLQIPDRIERLEELAYNLKWSWDYRARLLFKRLDPDVWKKVTRMSLDIAAKLPDVTSVDLGGGFKVGRMPGEKTVDMSDVGAHVRLTDFFTYHQPVFEGASQTSLEARVGKLIVGVQTWAARHWPFVDHGLIAVASQR